MDSQPTNNSQNSSQKSQNNPPEFEVNFINPEEVISQMDLRPGNKVADFGCGTGYFTFPLAKKLKEGGTVYALDVLKEKLESIESQAKILDLTNIITKRVNVEKEKGSKFEDGELDWVVIKDMLFQNKNKRAIIEEAKRVLKPEGKLLIVEWGSDDFSVGPEKELRISKESLLSLVNESQLAVIKEVQAGNFHYGLILSK